MSEQKMIISQLQSDGSYLDYLPKADAWTKDETISSQTATTLGLGSNYKPDDAFLGLYFGAGTYGYRVRVLFDDGKPCSGCIVSGLTQITGLSLTTDDDGYVLGKSTSTSVTVSITVPYLDWKTPSSQKVTSTGIVTDIVFTLEKVTDMLTITSSKTSKISSYVKSVDIGYVGGGGTGEDGEGPKSFYKGGSGAAGGYKKRLLLTKEVEVKIAIGSRNSSTNATTSSVTLDNSNINLDVSWETKVNSEEASGETGFKLFGDGIYLGSSGGAGRKVQDAGFSNYYSKEGYSGGIGAGTGGEFLYFFRWTDNVCKFTDFSR